MIYDLDEQLPKRVRESRRFHGVVWPVLSVTTQVGSRLVTARMSPEASQRLTANRYCFVIAQQIEHVVYQLWYDARHKAIMT